MAETDKHIQLIIDLRMALQTFFLTVDRVYVGSNLMCYYVEGDPSQSVSPDVFVARGATKGERRVYKCWEDPVPQVVLEISSRKTRKEDFGKKKDLYARLGVREYYVFDPEARLRAPLRAFRLHGAAYGEAMVTGNRVESAELGLELVVTGNTLRLYNPRTKEFLRTPAEEAAARQAAETRAARLAAKLRELGLDPDDF